MCRAISMSLPISKSSNPASPRASIITISNGKRASRSISRDCLILALACHELFGAPGRDGRTRRDSAFSTMILKLGLGVERLRRRGGDHGGRGRRGASGKSGKNGASDKDAKASGHLRLFPICAGAIHAREPRKENR